MNENYDVAACVADILDLTGQKNRIALKIKERKKEAKSNGISTKALNLAIKLMGEEKIERDLKYGEAQEILRESGADPIDFNLFENLKNAE